MEQPIIKRAIFIIVTLVIILVFIFIAISTISKKTSEKNRPNNIMTSPAISINPTTAGKKIIQSLKIGEQENISKERLAIVKQVLDWFNSLKDNEGKYPLGLVCNRTGCGKPVKDNRAGISAIWARFKYYEQTKNENELAILDEDLTTYAEKVTPIQNYFWNCKIMHEIWANNLLNTIQRTRAKQICDKSLYLVPALDRVNELIDSKKDAAAGLDMLVKNPAYIYDNKVNKDSLIEYSTAASDYVYKYFWSRSQKDLKIANHFFNFALQAYNMGQKQSGFEGKWFLATAAFDLSKINNNQNLNNFINDLIKKNEKDNCLILSECASKSYFFLQLGNDRRLDVYKDSSNNVLNKIIDYGFDDSTRKGYSYGQSAFHNLFADGDVFFGVNENSLIAVLLANK